MTKHQELKALFEGARTIVSEGPNHQLPLGWRQAIWARIGPRGKPGAPDSFAQSQRAELAASSAEQALPIWRRHFGQDDLPVRALQTSRALLDGRMGVEPATAISDELWRRLLHMSDESESFSVAAGFAAAQALNVALFDEWFDAANIDLGRPDDDDPETMDAACFSAIAISGGFPADSNANAGRRLDFWNWWLDRAWRLVGD